MTVLAVLVKTFTSRLPAVGAYIHKGQPQARLYSNFRESHACTSVSLSSSLTSVMWTDSVREFIINYSWLATPIIAGISWCQTWIIASLLLSKGMSGDIVQSIEESRQHTSFVRPSSQDRDRNDPGASEESACNYVAEQRYTGLAKRTVIAAWLADGYTATPKKVVGVMGMDPGLSTQLLDLYHPVCDAGYVTYISFLVQVIASFYGIVTVSIIWAQNAHLKQEPYGIQLQQQLAALTINRGMWSIAALGAFYTWAPLHAIYLTTIIAVVLEFLFVARGFLIGWQMNLLPGVLGFFVVLAWLLPSAEALTLILGLIAMKMEVSFISPKVIIFGLPALWLVIGPLLIIGASLGSHFGMVDCLVGDSTSSLCATV